MPLVDRARRLPWTTAVPVLALVVLAASWGSDPGVVAAVLLAFVLPAEARVDGSHNAIRDANGAMEIEQPGFLGWPPLATDDNG